MIDSWRGMGGESRGNGLGLPAADRIARSLLGAARSSGPGVGERLGEFDLLERLAVSSVEALFRAKSSSASGSAIVVLRRSGGDRWELQIEAELAAIAASGDPRLVPILATGRTPEQLPWCAFPAPMGRGIGRWCAESAASLETRLQLLGGFVAAVAALHAHGAPHGALCEESVFVDEQGARPRVRIAPRAVSASQVPDEDRRPTREPSSEGDLRAISAISIAALSPPARSRGPAPEGIAGGDAASLPWRVGRELRRLLSLGERGEGTAALLASAFARRVGGEIDAE